MRKDEAYLTDLIDAAEDIQDFLSGQTPDAFISNDRLRSAVMWKLMIIGEVASRLSPETKALCKSTPWEQIRGFRNIIVHGYFSLDWQQVWLIATRDVPELLKQAKQARNEIK